MFVHSLSLSDIRLCIIRRCSTRPGLTDTDVMFPLPILSTDRFTQSSCFGVSFGAILIVWQLFVSLGRIMTID